jgi:hypothetical protein
MTTEFMPDVEAEAIPAPFWFTELVALRRAPPELAEVPLRVMWKTVLIAPTLKSFDRNVALS